MTLARENYMRVLTAMIVAACALLIALYAYLNRFATVLLIVVMGALVWLIHYFIIYPRYTKTRASVAPNLS